MDCNGWYEEDGFWNLTLSVHRFSSSLYRDDSFAVQAVEFPTIRNAAFAPVLAGQVMVDEGKGDFNVQCLSDSERTYHAAL